MDRARETNLIRIFCKNTGKDYLVNPGVRLVDFLNQIKYADNSGSRILAAYVDNKLKELSFPLYMAHSVEFLTIERNDGRRTYQRSLCMVLQKAVYDLYPEYQLELDYTLPNGLYGELMVKEDCNSEVKENVGVLPQSMSITDADIKKIKDRMQELIEANLPIIKTKQTNSEAVSLFLRHGQTDKARLFETLGFFFVSVYYIDGYDIDIVVCFTHFLHKHVSMVFRRVL